MKLSRRDFAKLSAAISLFPWLMASRCSVDAVIAALDVASKVADSASTLLKPLNIQFANLLHLVSDDLLTVVRLYGEYEKADADKPSKFKEIQDILAVVVNNLTVIFAAIHVFNPGLQTIIRTAVGIANTAISLIIGALPTNHKAQARAMRMNLPPLPDIPGAKNADDLKKAWNAAVKSEHPEAVIQ